MTLAPTLQSGAGFEQPVTQGPSALQGVADIASSLVGVIQAGQPTAAQRKQQADASLNQGLVQGLQTAQALRDQGRNREADRLERRTLTQFGASGGDLGSSDTKATIQSLTGRDFEDVGFSAEEIARREALEAPEYQAFFASTFGTNPEATPEEREDLAYSRFVNHQANEAMVLQTQVDWNSGQGQASRLAMLESWTSMNMGVLTLSGQQGRKVTNDDVQAAMLDFTNLRASVATTRPAGLPNSEWEPIENAFNRTQEALDLVLSLTSKEELESDLLMKVYEGVLSLSDASPAEQNLLIQQFKKGGSDLITSGAIPLNRVTELLQSVNEIDSNDNLESLEAGNGNSDFTEGMATETFSEKEIEAASATTPEEAFKRSSDLATAAGSVQNVVGDPEAKGQWIAYTRTGLAGLYSMAAEQDSWASAEGYRKFFSPSFFNTMDSLRNSGNTFEYEAMRNKSIEAIDVNIAALRANIESRVAQNPQASGAGRGGGERGEGYSYDVVSNTILYNGEPLSKRHTRQTRRGTRPGGNTVFEQNLLDRAKAISQLQSFKDRLPTTQEELQGGAGETGLEGSEGSDVVSFIERLGQRESGGDYGAVNTLGFTGLLQFGQPRLDDYNRANGTSYSLAEFKDSPEIQDTVNEWHIRDIDRAIDENGLTEQGLSRDGLRAVAHLGGTTGMLRFAEGGYNPSDDYGTSLREYYEEFSQGDGTPPPASPRPQGRPETLRADVSPSRPQVQAQSTSTPQTQSTPSTPSEDGSTEVSRESQPPARRVAQATNEWDQLEAQTQKLLLRLFGNEEAVIQALATGELSEEDL